MGAVTVKLGVSGATVAFITRTYDELVHSIRSIDRESMGLLFKGRIGDFWQKINGNYLAVLLAGILTGIFTVATLMVYLLQDYAIPVWSFFFGLILISASLVLREIKIWNVKIIFSFVIGIAVSYTLTVLPPIQFPTNHLFTFIAGFLAACGLALPGVSGTSTLLLTGEYQYIVNAIINLQVGIMAIFALGCVVGVVTVSRLLTRLLINYPNSSLALLSGLTVGSLNKVWPWRAVIEYITNTKGEQVPVFDKSILPWDYVAMTGKDPLIFQAILMMAVGVFTVVLIEKITTGLKTKN